MHQQCVVQNLTGFTSLPTTWLGYSYSNISLGSFSSPPTSHCIFLDIRSLHMQSSHRIFTSSSSISRTRQNTTETCKVSCCPRLSDYRTHSTTITKILDIPSLPRYTSFSSHISSFSPYSRRFFHSKPSSSALRFHSPKVGLTHAMPNSGKRKGASREIDISKNLSYLLRHGAESEGIELDEGGWASVADVVGFSCLVSLSFSLFVQNAWLLLQCLSYTSPMCPHRSR